YLAWDESAALIRGSPTVRAGSARSAFGSSLTVGLMPRFGDRVISSESTHYPLLRSRIRVDDERRHLAFAVHGQAHGVGSRQRQLPAASKATTTTTAASPSGCLWRSRPEIPNPSMHPGGRRQGLRSPRPVGRIIEF